MADLVIGWRDQIKHEQNGHAVFSRARQLNHKRASPCTMEGGRLLVANLIHTIPIVSIDRDWLDSRSVAGCSRIGSRTTPIRRLQPNLNRSNPSDMDVLV